jgi:CheY-like chemotaxis protein
MKNSILIVDDDTAILEMTEDIFKSFGWEVYTATSATEALQEFKLHTPPLILADLLLNDNIGGVGIAARVSEMAPLTLIVGMTGLGGGSFTLANLRKHGFDHILAKPISLESFRFMLHVVETIVTGWEKIGSNLGP